MTEPMPGLQVEEQAREQDEPDQEGEAKFLQQRHADMPICGGDRGRFNNLI